MANTRIILLKLTNFFRIPCRHGEEVSKNTGYLNGDERKWLLDFFPSNGKYLYAGNYLRRIVVTDSNVSYTDRELPSNYTFTFKYADARPLLNLPRTDVPTDVLNITVPEVGSFTVPPRLAEFPRLPLSEGALFPIQNPYSEEWSTTNVAAIGYYLADFFLAYLVLAVVSVINIVTMICLNCFHILKIICW